MSIGTPRFNGARLREAREARGISAVALAELADINNSAISHYETGRHAPTPETLARIATALNMPKAFFMRPSRIDDNTVLFWRSQSAATKVQRTRARRRFGWLIDVVSFLQNYIDFPIAEFPTFDLPPDPAELDAETIETLASETRRFWGFGDGPITDVVLLLENHGAIVTRSSFDARALDAFSQWCGSRPYVVLGSDKGSAARSTFDVAHELGHMILHKHVPLREINKSYVHRLLEEQAMRFAGAFLLPATTFPDDLYSTSLEVFRMLKSRWGVAIAAMIMRARHLDLIGEQETRYLWIKMSKKGWRRQEPMDADSQPEQPRLLRRAFDLLLEEGVVSAKQLQLHLALRADDIESVVGLPHGYFRKEVYPQLRLRH